VLFGSQNILACCSEKNLPHCCVVALQKRPIVNGADQRNRIDNMASSRAQRSARRRRGLFSLTLR